MFSLRVAGLIAIGGLAIGCASSHHNEVSTPQASQQVEPNAQQSSGALERSWQMANPGSRVGQVNAVLPARRMISVADLPRGEINRGDVVTILLDPSGTSTLAAAVVAKNEGYVQLAYPPLQAGQRDPAVGDLAVWYPGGAAVPPGALHPGMAGSAGMSEPTYTPPSNSPAVQMENTTTPPPANPPVTNTPSDNAMPPSTQPAQNTAPPASTNTPTPAENPAPPTTQPSSPTPTQTPPPARQPELNK